MGVLDIDAVCLLIILLFLSAWIAVNTGTKNARKETIHADPSDGIVLSKRMGLFYFNIAFQISNGERIEVKARKRDFQYGIFVIGDKGYFKQADHELTCWNLKKAQEESSALQEETEDTLNSAVVKQ